MILSFLAGMGKGKGSKAVALALACLSIFAVLALYYTQNSFLDAFEAKTYDLRFKRLRGPIPVNPGIAIVAIGFNIIYNTTGIINFAQGEFLVIGALTAISLSAHLPLPVAIAAAVVITALVGALLHLIFLRWIPDASVLRIGLIEQTAEKPVQRARGVVRARAYDGDRSGKYIAR